MNEEKSISVIIPVFHEQERINRLIDYLTSLPDGEAVEIIVVDGAAVTRVPYGDQAPFIKKDVFTEIGGYKDYQLFEDVELMERLRRRGHRITLLKRKVLTSGRRFRTSGFLRGVSKVILLLLLYKAGVHPDTLSKMY